MLSLGRGLDGEVMESRTTTYTTKELSKETLPDFEKLFSGGNGWDFCKCMAYQRGSSNLPKNVARTRAEAAVVNSKAKKELVEKGQAHGILVYADGEPVGWCQFGPKDELPLAEYRRKHSPPASQATRTQWRITCFVTDKSHQKGGVARIALRAALEAIRKRGGGLVEARPVAHLPLDSELIQLVRDYGPESNEVRRHVKTSSGGRQVNVYDSKPWSVDGVPVEGVGPVTAYYVRYVDMFHPGTVSMFEREGFKAVSRRGRRVVMQKALRKRRP
jgi:GNAT superfamily N-acetyltransferase